MNPYLYQSGIMGMNYYAFSGIVVLLVLWLNWLFDKPIQRFGRWLLEHKFWGEKEPEKTTTWESDDTDITIERTKQWPRKVS